MYTLNIGYRKGFVTIGLVLITVSFVFVFSYIGFIINKQYARITRESPINVTGLDPQNPLNLLIFAILTGIGTGVLVKGFR